MVNQFDTACCIQNLVARHNLSSYCTLFTCFVFFFRKAEHLVVFAGINCKLWSPSAFVNEVVKVNKLHQNIRGNESHGERTQSLMKK